MSRGTPTPTRPHERIIDAFIWIRRPEHGAIGQGIRYALAGATVALVSVTITIVLSQGVGMAFEASFAIGFVVAMATHFTLQRLFVWSHHEEFALPLHHQLVRYLPVALTNYGLVALAIAVLPHALDTSSLVVYLAATAVVTLASFLIFRGGVFHAEDAPEESS